MPDTLPEVIQEAADEVRRPRLRPLTYQPAQDCDPSLWGTELIGPPELLIGI